MTNQLTQIADHHERLRALLPEHSFIVQAPAGSGKTELLTQRFLRLLTTVQQPEHILAITFTRKAASEMRNRIFLALRNASTTERPEQPHHAQTWELARAALQADQKNQWQLLLHPSRLRIQTIDALNTSLACRLPILSGIGAGLEITTDADALYQSAIQRLLEQLGDGSAVAMQLEVLLFHTANRIPALMEMLCNLLSKRDHWLPLMQHHDEHAIRASMENTLCAAIQHHLELLSRSIPVELQSEIVELVCYSANNRLNDNAKAELQPLLAACASISSLPGTHYKDVSAWQGVATVLCKQDGDFYSALNKTQGFPTDNKEMKHRMLAMLNALRDINGLAELFTDLHTLPAASYSESQWRVLAALFKVLPQAVAHLKVEFQQHGKIDFVEQALRALEALGSDDNPTDLALSLDMRLQHILVDEFQDTSITQMSLLRMLTAGWTNDDGRSLFCVGDPMQSIYRFRQAEVGLFLDVQRQGFPNVVMESLQLQTNFRSNQPVVEWINRQFPLVLPAINDSEQGAVKFSPCVVRTNAPQNGGIHIHAAIDRNAQQEAHDVVEVVKRSLQDDAQQRIAILVGGRSHVNAIASALATEHIAFNAVDIERLQDRQLIQDLISLTRALLHLGDRTAWLACLRAPWCGLTLHDLHAIAADNADATIWSLLNDGKLMQQMSLDSVDRLQKFKHVMKTGMDERGRFSLHDWVQRCWFALSGPAVLNSEDELQDANAYFARLDEIEEAGDLPDLTQLESQLQNLFAAPVNDAIARVEIMTIHKSKGLEFDVVIIPSLHRSSQRDKTQLLRWTQLTGLRADGLVLSPPQEKGHDNDAIHEWLKQLEQRRSDLERGRLLYVAVTRARKELHLFGSASLDSKGEKINPPRKGTLLSLLWNAVEPVFNECIHQPSTPINTTMTMPLLRRLPLDWQPPAVADALTSITSPSINDVDAPIEFDWVSETGRHVGTVVHAELESLMNSSREQKLKWQAQSRRSIILSMLAEQGVPEALRAHACERVIEAINNILNDSRGRWIIDADDQHHDAHSELALSGVIDGVVVNSVIDRTFVDTQGIRWIIDFKTSTHEGADLETFLRSEEQRYKSQLQRYATLMRRWKPDQPVKTVLYFPLLREWRELK